MATKKDSLIELYNETKNYMVLNRLLALYGPYVLCEMGPNEMNLFISKITKDHSLLYGIEKVEKIREIYNYIYEKWQEFDYDFCTNIITLIATLNYNKFTNRHIVKENTKFIINLISLYRKASKELQEDELVNYEDLILDAISDNISIKYDEIILLCNEYPHLYITLISNIWKYKGIRNMLDLLIELSEVKDNMDSLISSGKVDLFNSEEYLKEGIDLLIVSNWGYTYIYHLIAMIGKMKISSLIRFRDIMTLFIDSFFSQNESIIKDVVYRYNLYKEDEFKYPLELVSKSLDKEEIEGIFYSIYYGKELIEANYNLLNFDRNGIVEAITDFNSTIDALLESKIIPEYAITNTEKYIEDIANKFSDNRITEFNVDEYLANSEDEEIEDEE